MTDLIRPSPGRRLRPAFVGLFLMAMSISGCARERVSVTVGAHGTWTRSAVYVVQVNKITSGTSTTPAGQVGDTFVLPSGVLWKMSTQTSKDERLTTAERTLPLGEAVRNDIAVRGSSAAVPGPNAPPQPAESASAPTGTSGQLQTLTTNSAVVKQPRAGRYVYSETIHWIGKMPDGLHRFEEKQTALVRSALPSALATNENVKFVADSFIREFDLALIGPPRPLVNRLPLLMSAPEVFERLVRQRISKGIVGALKQRFGEKLTTPQLQEIAATLVQRVTDDLRISGPSQAEQPPGVDSNKNSSGASIFITVKLPGEIVETNGVADKFSGVVTWSFYPEAAALGDVTLTAISDASSRRGAR